MLSERVPNEMGVGFVKYTFKDSLGNLVVPKVANWTLFDVAGNIINSRKNVAITELSSVGYIRLEGFDLLLPKLSTRRRIVIYYIYDSDLGSNISDNVYLDFDINRIYPKL